MSRFSVIARFLTGLLAVLFLLTAGWSVHALPRDIIVIRASDGNYRFNVELAATEAERAQGLMFRKELPTNAGMLFLYDRDQAVTFWMRNTYLPLDMVFIAADGKITQIVKNTKPLSENLIPSYTYIRAVLELNAGITNRYGIRVGDRVDYKAFRMPVVGSSRTPLQ